MARYAGTVTGDVRADENGATFAFALDYGIVVRAHVRDATIVPGERVLVRGRLVPFDEPRNPGEPSRRAIALGEGLAGELAGNRVLARAPPDPRDVRTWAARARAALSERLRAVLREPEATVVAGALWGERGTLPRDIRDDFQATGTVHVLVTAGLHLGVIAMLVRRLLRYARVPRTAAALSAIPCVVAYAWLSGAHLPSQRAAVMVSVALLAAAYGARLVSWNALALAALVVAALWPASVTTVSFALSFSCVSAIVLFARSFERALERCAVPERLREPLALTISTQIGVWPLSAATFGVLAPYAMPANAIVVPATGVAMIAGIAALAFAHVPVLGQAAATVAAWDVDAILYAVRFAAALPGARVWVAPPPALAIVAYDLRRGNDRANRAAARHVPRARADRARERGRAADDAAPARRTADDHDARRRPRRRDRRANAARPHDADRQRRPPRTRRGRGRPLTGGTRRRTCRPGVLETPGRAACRLTGEHASRTATTLADLRRSCARSKCCAVADSGQAYGGRAFNDGLREAALRHVPVRVVRCGDRWSSDDGVVAHRPVPVRRALCRRQERRQRELRRRHAEVPRLSHALHRRRGLSDGKPPAARRSATFARTSSKWAITDLPMRPAAISWTPCSRATR